MMVKQNNDKHYVYHVRCNSFTIDIPLAQRVLKKLLVQKHIYFLILHFNSGFREENDNEMEQIDELQKNEKEKE